MQTQQTTLKAPLLGGENSLEISTAAADGVEHSPAVGRHRPPQSSLAGSSSSAPPRLYRARWLMLALYSLVSGVNSMVWISISSISSIAMEYYGVSDATVNMLPVSFYLIYVPLVPPAVWLLERHGLRPTLLVAASFLAAGCATRAAGVDPTPGAFGYVLAGNCIISISTPFIFACTTSLGARWFGPGERGTATAIAVSTNQLGLVVGFVWPPLAVPPIAAGAGCAASAAARAACVRATGAAIRTLNEAQAALAALALLGVALLFRSAPPTPPTRAQAAQAAAKGERGGGGGGGGLGVLAQLRLDTVAAAMAPGMPPLLCCFAFAVSSYWTLSVLLNETLTAKGFTARQIMLPGALLLALGLPGMLYVGALLDRTRAYRRTVRRLGAAVVALMVAFSLALQVLPHGDATLALVAAICSCLGFVFSALQPALLELAAELTYPLSENISCSLVFLGAQFSGCAFVYAAEALETKVQLAGKPVGSMVRANWFFTCAIVAGLAAFVLGPRGKLKRCAAEEEHSSGTAGGRGGAV